MTLYQMEESPDKTYVKYRGLIKSLINSIVVNNPAVVDTQDLQQAGALAVVIALKSYDPSLGSFSIYLRKCIRNALLEQANSFNSIFTVDEKVRRQANAVSKMRNKGYSDSEIMARLGIKTRATFLSLLELVDNSSIDFDQIELSSRTMSDEISLTKMIDEIGFTQPEIEFINFVINDCSMDEIRDNLGISRSNLYTIKASIRDKILAWGRGE